MLSLYPGRTFRSRGLSRRGAPLHKETCIITAEGMGGGGDETEGRRVKHHMHTVLYIVHLSGILMGVLVLGLIFCVVTHKGNSRSSALQRPPPPPPRLSALLSHIGRPRWRRRRGGDNILLIKKPAPFHCSPQITVLRGEKKTTQGKRMFAATHCKIVIIIIKKVQHWLLEVSHEAYSR